jgi:hypothetical protein
MKGLSGIANKVFAQSAEKGALPTLYAAIVPRPAERVLRRSPMGRSRRAATRVSGHERSGARRGDRAPAVGCFGGTHGHPLRVRGKPRPHGAVSAPPTEAEATIRALLERRDAGR